MADDEGGGGGVRRWVGAAEIEMPYLEDEKGASGWSAVEVRSLAKISRGIKGDTACGNTKQFQRFEPFPVVRTRVPEIPRFQLEFLHVEVEVESESRADVHDVKLPVGSGPPG